MQKETKDIIKRSAIRALWIVVLVFMVYLLQGCGNRLLAPVEERDATGKKAESSSFYPPTEADNSRQYYTVKRGDTLYSIAFRYGVDFKTLAKTNGINANYTIYPGQRLNLQKARDHKPVLTQVATNTTKTSTRVTPTQRHPKTIPPKNTTQNNHSITNTPVANKPVSKPTTVKTEDKPATEKATAEKKATEKPTVEDQSYDLGNKAVKYWMWPAMGAITKDYNVAKGSKGIDIAGNMGDAVRAAAAGRVVYAGRGLRGYGNLVIIKHNNDYISAYAHNKTILVKENEIIKAGQKIAEIGNTDSDSPKLHFEIRYKGKPTNPMKFLPKR